MELDLPDFDTMNVPSRPPLRRRRRARCRRRGGIETFEVLAAVPLLMVATLAILELGLLLVVHQAVTSAAIEGARAAGKAGSTLNSAAALVQQHLQVHQIQLTPTGVNLLDNARLVVEDGAGVISGDRGNTSLTCSPHGTAPNANQVRVTVCIQLSNAANVPVPNWLSTLGFSLTGRNLEVSALAPRE